VGVELHGARRAYRSRRGEVTAIESLDLVVRAGEIVALVGPSGCGKTTVLELVAGLQEPDSGSIAVGGQAAPAARRARCAHMPQRDLLLPWRDALSNAALALEAAGVRSRDARRRAAPLFERFGLGGFERSAPSELSPRSKVPVAAWTPFANSS